MVCIFRSSSGILISRPGQIPLQSSHSRNEIQYPVSTISHQNNLRFRIPIFSEYTANLIVYVLLIENFQIRTCAGSANLDRDSELASATYLLTGSIKSEEQLVPSPNFDSLNLPDQLPRISLYTEALTSRFSLLGDKG